jgi:hypothetical protein
MKKKERNKIEIVFIFLSAVYNFSLIIMEALPVSKDSTKRKMLERKYSL